MGVRFDNATGTWIAFHAKRHPITRMPKSLKRIGLKSEAEARRVEKALVIKIEHDFHAQVVPKWPTLVSEFLSAKRKESWTAKTFETYRLCLEAHTYDLWKNRLIDSITAQEIRDLIANKVGHRSASHQKNLLKFIRGAFTYAVDSGVLSKNPTPTMKFKIGDKIKKVLTQEQVRSFLNTAKEMEVEWYPHWAMACYTGMRSGELYALTWDKVNLEADQILVDSSWNNKDGFKSTKSGDDRMVEIAPNLKLILSKLKLQTDSNFVLPRIDKWDKGEQARELRMFLSGMSLPSVRFHDLRATWATILLGKGIEPIKVMKMGGWKDLKTMQIYIRKAGVDIKGITATLDLHNPSMEVAKVLNFESRSDA